MVEDTRPPIDYMQRTKDYYLGLDMAIPINGPVLMKFLLPNLSKSCPKMRIAIITTAAPYQPDKGDQGPEQLITRQLNSFVYRLPIEPEPDLRVSHIAIDSSYKRKRQRHLFAACRHEARPLTLGKIGSIAPHIYGFPTNRSQRTNMDIDCPQLIRQLQKDQIEGIIAVPNCPVCHQSISLAARAAEAVGIASVIMGCALDIARACRGAPLLFFRFSAWQ